MPARRQPTASRRTTNVQSTGAIDCGHDVMLDRPDALAAKLVAAAG